MSINFKNLKLLEKNKFFLVLFLLILVIPNGSSYFFSGLPWLNRYETILVAVIVPFIIILDSSVFRFNFLRLILYFLVVIKIILIMSPQTGVGHKQYFNSQQLDEEKFIPTYDSFWYKKYSSVQKFDWKKKRNFPIDWSFRHPINIKEKDSSGKKTYHYETLKDLMNNFDLTYEIEFFFYLKEKSKIKFDVQGAEKKSFITIKRFDKKNETSQFLLNELNEGNDLALDKGIYKANGVVEYEGDRWSFVPLISSNDENFKSIFLERQVFLDLTYDYSLNELKFFVYLGVIFDHLILILIALILLILFFKISKFDRYLPLVFLAGYIFVDYVFTNFLKLVDLQDHYGSASLAIAISLFLFVFCVFSFQKKYIIQKKYPNPIKSLIYIVGPTYLYFFYSKFGNSLEIFPWFSAGDDWEAFSIFARQIVVENIWFSTSLYDPYNEVGDGIRRWAIRFVFAFIHVLFGKSAFSQQIMEVWLVFGSGMILISILNKLKLSYTVSIIGGLLLIIIITGENYRWLIGRGLTNFYSMFIILIICDQILNFTERNLSKLIFISLCAATISWFREDHIFLALGLIAFSYHSNGNILNTNYFFSNLMSFLKKNYLNLAIYLSIVIFGFIIIFLKNYYTFGTLGLYQEAMWSKVYALKNIFIGDEIKTYAGIKVSYWNSFYRMLTAAEPARGLPRITTIFLTGGLILSLFLVFFRNPINRRINIGLIISPIACIIPCFFISMINYNPVYTLHYLPFTIMIVMYFINYNISRITEKTNQKNL